ncbi:hypothetical protein PENTCL1PPCAC_23685, partial [Pristionchus entomophagus]
LQDEEPITVRPAEAETRLRSAIAVAVAKTGGASLFRVLSLIPDQTAILKYLNPKEATALLAVSSAVRTALSSKNVDITYWKAKLNKEFPRETVVD